MANTCDACCERSTRLTYPAGGLWAGRWFCRDCASGRKKITRLSSLVAFRFRLAEVLPPGDPMTAPAVRLMMAVDDVRRAQIHMVEAMDRLDDPAQSHRALGDFLYFVRLLLSLSLTSPSVRAGPTVSGRQRRTGSGAPTFRSASRATRCACSFAWSHTVLLGCASSGVS